MCLLECARSNVDRCLYEVPKGCFGGVLVKGQSVARQCC